MRSPAFAARGSSGFDNTDDHSNSNISIPTSSAQVTVLAAGLALAARGLPVFPCSRLKAPTRPKHQDGNGFKDATRDPAEVRHLWRHWPGELIGVPTGTPSGIFVLEVDDAKHPEAAEWFARHATALPETRCHRTQSGGSHFLFQHRAGLRNTESQIALGVDTRGEGGYAIWWPAHVPHGHHVARLAEIPDWLAERSRKPDVVPHVAPFLRGHGGGGYGRAALDAECRALTAAACGTRNRTLNRASFCLHQLVAGGELDEGEVHDALLRAAIENGLIKEHGLRAVEATIKSGAKAGMRSPRGRPQR
jgi:Bifunctional DNA primase/polymerase, N-terminal